MIYLLVVPRRPSDDRAVTDTYAPKPLDRFFEQGKRFYILYGGRARAKFWEVAAELIEMSIQTKLKRLRRLATGRPSLAV
ncbi:MAG: hypothetical protein ACRBM6_04445 [Geminicoccales bacterium]